MLDTYKIVCEGEAVRNFVCQLYGICECMIDSYPFIAICSFTIVDMFLKLLRQMICT